jgi:polyphosphate glucokinase
MPKKAIGIDIGGTGIKGAIVDVKEGRLIGDRVRYETPEGGKPKDIADAVAKMISELGGSKALQVGICFPAVVKHGKTMSAANISDDWIGLDADALFTKRLGRHVHILNDADAAGVAEAKFGAARKKKGLTILTTLGTGIGVALLYNGELIPNAELGHLEIDGVDAETVAAFSAKEREGLTWEQWAKRLQAYYSTLERLFTPDLFVVGGGVSKEYADFLPLLKLKTEIVPAAARNSAGILGAAAMAYKNRED